MTCGKVAVPAQAHFRLQTVIRSILRDHAQLLFSVSALDQVCKGSSVSTPSGICVNMGAAGSSLTCREKLEARGQGTVRTRSRTGATASLPLLGTWECGWSLRTATRRVSVQRECVGLHDEITDTHGACLGGLLARHEMTSMVIAEGGCYIAS